MNASLKLENDLNYEKCQIFISYRSQYANDVSKLCDRIRKGEFHNNIPKTVYFLPPGKLTFQDEIFTEARWWQLQSIIYEDFMSAADEVWIYNDVNNDYFKSWWTQGEVVSYAYNKSNAKLLVYNQAKDDVKSADTNYLIRLSKKEKKRLARLFSNTSRGTMGPDARQAMKNWRLVPWIGRLNYFHDNVWSDEFWESYLFPCSECSKSDSKIKVDINEFDIKYFIWLKENQDLRRVSAKNVEDIVSRNDIYVCPSCELKYKIIPESTIPRYIWYPIRYGRQTGPEGMSIEEYPVYRINKIEKEGEK